jgi:hypothetical protein
VDLDSDLVCLDVGRGVTSDVVLSESEVSVSVASEAVVWVSVVAV